MDKRELVQLYQNQPLKLRLYARIRLLIFDFDKLLTFLPERPISIYDIGCGYGLFSFILAAHYPHSAVKAFDADRKRIQTLKAMNPYQNLEFIHQDALSMDKFEAGTIIFNDLLHHLAYQDQKRLLSNIRANAPENVTLVVKDMDKGRFSIRQFFNYLIDVVNTKEFGFHYHTRETFNALFASCGFKINRQGYANSFFIPLNHLVTTLSKAED